MTQKEMEETMLKLMHATMAELLLDVVEFLCKKADIPLHFVKVADGKRVAVPTPTGDSN